MGSNYCRVAESCMRVQHVLGEQEMEPVEVTPYLFENWLILSLDPRWVLAFGGSLSFKAFLDRRRRLCLVSRERLR